MRNEKGLLVYDDEFRRRFMTPKEIALNDEWTEQHATLIDAKERGEISAQEYERLCKKLDAAHDDERRRIRDEKFNVVATNNDEKFFVPPMFAHAWEDKTVYRILFYENSRGENPVLEYIEKLALRDDKDSRIKFDNVMDCIDQLRVNGTRAPENFVKHIDDEIWELRPLRDRILFAAWVGNSFVLLHQFLKDTPKTPRSEIEKAERELADFKERFGWKFFVTTRR